jgi:hypothetical protein
MNKRYIFTITRMEKPHSSALRFKQTWTQVPHLQTSDSCKLTHVSGCALPDLVWGGLAVLPRGPPKSPNVAHAQP